MVAAIFIWLAVATILIVWATIAVLSSRGTWRVRLLHFAFCLAAAVAAYFTTFQYSYYANVNTQIHGWPFPVVVFQRQDASAPWVDYVSSAIALIYPMNFALYAGVPAIMSLILLHRSSSRKKPVGEFAHPD